MAIKSIRVSNFKSFGDLKVDLGAFNVLIGANASGKSNFVQVFRFLRDMSHQGLENAVSMQGGVEYLRNIRIGSSRDLALRVVYDERFTITMGVSEGERTVGLRAEEEIYEFATSFNDNAGSFDIAHDTLTLKGEFLGSDSLSEGQGEANKLGFASVVFANVGGKLFCHSDLPEGAAFGKALIYMAPVARKQHVPPRTLLTQMIPILFFLYPGRANLISDVSIYDFDPKLPKKAIPITGRAEMEEDGSNLAIVLRSILEHGEKRRKFLNLLKDVLGFVDAVEVMPLADRSLLFSVQESYTRDAFLPASFLSDGTIHVVALIIALYFDEKSLVIIEEPERNIHPFLIARVVDMLKEASQKKQIIVTTHNPEVVKHAGVENILLVSRNKEGFSTITRPSDSEQVAVFLKNEIGIEDLFVQDLLGA